MWLEASFGAWMSCGGGWEDVRYIAFSDLNSATAWVRIWIQQKFPDPKLSESGYKTLFRTCSVRIVLQCVFATEHRNVIWLQKNWKRSHNTGFDAFFVKGFLSGSSKRWSLYLEVKIYRWCPVNNEFICTENWDPWINFLVSTPGQRDCYLHFCILSYLNDIGWSN